MSDSIINILKRPCIEINLILHEKDAEALAEELIDSDNDFLENLGERIRKCITQQT
jgi:hypothetical protein